MTSFMLDTTRISLAGAQAMVAAARQEAERRGVAVSVAVLDSGGHLVAFARLDGVHVGTAAVATAKARTAVFYNRSTSTLAGAIAQGNVAMLNLPDLVPLPGGLPIAGGAGAIGVSGAAPDVDEAIAAAGLAALSQEADR